MVTGAAEFMVIGQISGEPLPFNSVGEKPDELYFSVDSFSRLHANYDLIMSVVFPPKKKN